MAQRAALRNVPALRRLPFAVACALALGGCADTRFGTGVPMVPKPADGALIRAADGPPDLARGQQAFEDGRLDDADRDFRRLAEAGYPDAAVELAATHAQRDTIDDEGEAQRWYRSVLRKRPAADLGLARVLTATGKRADGEEALALIRRAKKTRNAPQADGVLLALFTAHPGLDRDNEAPGLAAASARSPLALDRVQAVNWYRINIGVGDHAARLRALCETDRANAPNCFAELARFRRYQGEAAQLDALVTEGLAAFEALARAPAAEGGRTQQTAAIGRAAAQLATSMVDQIEIVDVPEIYENFRNNAAEVATVREETRAGADTPLLQTATGTPEATPTSVATPTRPDLADKVLRWMLAQGGEYPAYAADVVGRFEYLIPDVNLASVLKPMADAGSHEAALQLGQVLSSSERGFADTPASEKYLLQSLKYRSTRQRAYYQLARLYERGFLGSPDTQKTIDYLVEAARGGDLRSHTRLARVFYGIPGFRVNRIGAYVFAKIAEDAGRPVIITERVLPRDLQSSSAAAPTAAATAGYRVAVRMLDRLKTELTAAELEKAEALYQAERALQPKPRPPIPADIYSRKSS